MNEINKYIKSKLEIVIGDFPEVSFKYEYQSQSDAYYIEINPDYQFDSILMKEVLADILFEFYDLFPNDNIVFVTKNDGIILDSPKIISKSFQSSKTWININNDSNFYIEPIEENSNYSLAA